MSEIESYTVNLKDPFISLNIQLWTVYLHGWDKTLLLKNCYNIIELFEILQTFH